MEAGHVDLDTERFEKIQKEIKESQDIKMKKEDYIFVSLICSLQILRRWLVEKYVINGKRYNDSELAKKVKHQSPVGKIENEDYGTWILGSACYDAVNLTDGMKRRVIKPGISGANHRYATLAHDPLLGLVFGPLNLLSDTVTVHKTNIRTYETKQIDWRIPSSGYKISAPSSLLFSVKQAAILVQEDPKMFYLAILKHLIHLASDSVTIQGLSIPGANALPNDIDKWLLKNGFDSAWFFGNGLQYLGANVINRLSRFVYTWLFSGSADDTELIREKALKDIAIANSLATAENFAIIGSRLGITGDYIKTLRSVDFGGLIATIQAISQSKLVKEDIANIANVWDDIQFNFTVSGSRISQKFTFDTQTIDEKYRDIILAMQEEYESLEDLQKSSFDKRDDFQFENSGKYARVLNVDKGSILETQNDITRFFKN
ncbi:hypothetical protein [Furfurilactobacillus rossiae]|uniref:Uncharacterized protein n=1 Tax=Furfurilactobacillus rossiae DSM 15814 TaxID=1114972 RepID=A0A0R1R8M8_9LACO|nr:hypothetical protein [Furfurilactobacillus rossiae]KRL53520.1 hypothetical protein FD35_GL001059 [Furfurilactobacillus rossiae DSM 15814]QFR67655.1 hypothetical protein LR814_11300 [Furfurilactobacillus rossiae]QLE60616.1 hypothetical protein LROSRS0_0568 [Furfurilactobacillus rossiae]